MSSNFFFNFAVLICFLLIWKSQGSPYGKVKANIDIFFIHWGISSKYGTKVMHEKDR